MYKHNRLLALIGSTSGTLLGLFLFLPTLYFLLIQGGNRDEASNPPFLILWKASFLILSLTRLTGALLLKRNLELDYRLLYAGALCCFLLSFLVLPWFLLWLIPRGLMIADQRTPMIFHRARRQNNSRNEQP